MSTNTAYPITFTGTIAAIRLAGRSRNGNPFYDVAFSDGEGFGHIFTTQKDGRPSYEVGHHFEGKPARIHTRMYRGDRVIEGIEILSA